MPDLDIIEINDQLAQNARIIASGMSQPQIRKRGLIDMLGINCAISYLQNKKFRRTNFYLLSILIGKILRRKMRQNY